ncbi:DUF2188 domain-containing protein [Cohnella sp. GbtcB17]|uniref:DUF2188 domain-containing protein n=1 Tax=Cohnella sp. GbtcB17 TaxID=2824762 RepID=UPI001C2F1DE0|nr:DUF2188 domain-containing protein [Cohnella sp. GbtcB17]
MPNQHVVPHENGWAVRGEGSSRPEVVTNTKQEAVQAARKLAQEQRSELVIHGKDGRIQTKDSHGHDPYPPKG